MEPDPTPPPSAPEKTQKPEYDKDGNLIPAKPKLDQKKVREIVDKTPGAQVWQEGMKLPGQEEREEAEAEWSRGEFDPVGDLVVTGIRLERGEGRDADNATGPQCGEWDDCWLTLRGTPVAGSYDPFYTHRGAEAALVNRLESKWLVSVVAVHGALPRPRPTAPGRLRLRRSNSPTRNSPTTGVSRSVACRAATCVDSRLQPRSRRWCCRCAALPAQRARSRSLRLLATHLLCSHRVFGRSRAAVAGGLLPASGRWRWLRRGRQGGDEGGGAGGARAGGHFGPRPRRRAAPRQLLAVRQRRQAQAASAL